MPLARKSAANSYVLHAVLRAIAGDTLGGGGGAEIASMLVVETR